MADSGLGDASALAHNGVKRRGAVARTLIGDIIQFVDFAIVIIASIIVAALYHTFGLKTTYDFQNYAAAGIMGATGLTALLRRDGYYEFEQLLSSTRAFPAIVSRWALVILGLLAFGFALKISDNFSRVWLFAWSAGALASIGACRAIAAVILRRMSRAGGAFARRVALVGAAPLAKKFAKLAAGPETGISVYGVFATGLPGEEADPSIKPAGDLDTLVRLARAGEIDDVIITSPRVSQDDMARLVRRLSNLPVSVAICPNIHWLDHTGGAITKVGDATVLSLYRRPLEGWGGVLKNIEDFVLGAILLVAISPLMVLIALAIKIQGKGPILFSQQRHGFNNAVFRIYKFRTMTVAEDGEEIRQASRDDPRITPLGKFLRRYSLDELPQLLNVVKGDMSLVGPRPHALAHNHHYARLIEDYSGRHKVKPGITGWAQVNGFRGETSENEMMEQRVQYDLAYVDNWSLWFDLKILILTIKAVISPSNAY